MPDTEEARLEVIVEERTYDLITVLDPTEYDFEEGMTFTELTGSYLSDYEATVEWDNPRYVAFLIWCAVHRRDPSFTVAKLKKLNMVAVMQQIRAALESLAASAKERDAGPPEQPPAPATDSETPGEPSEPETAGPSGSSASESKTKPEASPESTPVASGFPT